MLNEDQNLEAEFRILNEPYIDCKPLIARDLRGLISQIFPSWAEYDSEYTSELIEQIGNIEYVPYFKSYTHHDQLVVSEETRDSIDPLILFSDFLFQSMTLNEFVSRCFFYNRLESWILGYSASSIYEFTWNIN